MQEESERERQLRELTKHTIIDRENDVIVGDVGLNPNSVVTAACRCEVGVDSVHAPGCCPKDTGTKPLGHVWRAGDRAYCVNASPQGGECSGKLEKLSELQEGKVYTVKEAYDYTRTAEGDWGLVLEEIETPFPATWRGSRFEPYSAGGAA